MSLSSFKVTCEQKYTTHLILNSAEQSIGRLSRQMLPERKFEGDKTVYLSQTGIMDNKILGCQQETLQNCKMGDGILFLHYKMN